MRFYPPRATVHQRTGAGFLKSGSAWLPERVIRFETKSSPCNESGIATGADVRAIECLLFMRNIESAACFELMKGCGVRIREFGKGR